MCYVHLVGRLSANLKHLLLALFLCVGMIGLSGPGAGLTCVGEDLVECGCSGMAPGESCCSESNEPLPTQAPLLPQSSAQQQVLQAIQFVRPVLFMLPLPVAMDFPQDACAPALSSTGCSLQALLCAWTV